MHLLLLLFCIWAIISPTYAPGETSTTATISGSCPPVTKRRRMINQSQPKRCFVAEFGIGLKKPCSSEPPEQLLKIGDYKSNNVAGVEGVSGSGVTNEADLILSRAGIFDWRQQPLENMFVCKTHYTILGEKFTTQRQKIQKNQKWMVVCAAPFVPAVSGKHPAGGTVKARHLFVTKEHSQVMMEKDQLLASVGDALCEHHYEYLQNLVVQHRLEMKGYEMRHAPTHPFSSAPYTAAGLRHIEQEHPTCASYSGASEEDDTDYVDANDDNEDPGSDDEANASIIRKCIRKIAEEEHIANIHFSKHFSSLSHESKLKRASAIERLFNVIIQIMAKDNPQELKQLLQKKLDKRLFLRQHTEVANQFLDSVAEAVMNAPSASLKRQALSLVALYIPYRELLEYIPNLSLYYYKAARRHAKVHGAGHLIPDEPSVRERYDRKKVDMFIEFITSPHIVVDLPYGMASVRHASGVKEEIPNLIRIMNDEHIITQYLAMLEQNSDQQYALSRSSLRRILGVCTAQTRKSLQGLDYFTHAAANGFDALHDITEKLGEYNQDQEWRSDVQNRLRRAKQYLKQEYKLHVAMSSSAADYVCMYVCM